MQHVRKYDDNRGWSDSFGGLDCQDDEVVDLPIYGVFRMTCVVGFADLWGVQDDMRLWVLLILGVFRMI